MRIGTWNLQRARGLEKNRQRLELIASRHADVWVLTETHDSIDLTPMKYRSVATDPDTAARVGERWVTIWSRFSVLDRPAVEDPVRTTAAVVDSPIGPMAIFGTVLPWHSDPGPGGGAKAWSEHHRVIEAQGEEWKRLAESPGAGGLCIAGDFNTSIGRPHFYGTKRGRDLLQRALGDADLAFVTDTDSFPPGLLRHPVIDHVCLSTALASRASVVEAWEGTTENGVKLSDHSGLVVEVVPG